MEQQAGFLLVDKPVGPTSYQMVHRVKRILGVKKVGHAGTLDPFASGLLIICVGRAATKLINGLMEGDKEYSATIRLGIVTDTQDRTGTEVARYPLPQRDDERLRRCLDSFLGETLQTPPSYSALKHKGKPLYYYARKGIKVAKEPRVVHIGEIELIGQEADLLRIRVVCGKGTYIRALAADIGERLGCGGHLVELRRERSGSFRVADAIPGIELDPESPEARGCLQMALRPLSELE